MSDARSDRERISDVLVRYATAIDTRDWPLFRTCFTEDVRADYGETGLWQGVDQITDFMAAAHQGMSSTRHMLSNFAIDLAGDAASAVSYVHAVLVLTREPLVWVDAVGRYADRFVRTPDGWRIRERSYEMTRLLTSGRVPASP